jgi:hypothetical protein
MENLKLVFVLAFAFAVLSANGSPLAQGKTSITFKFQMNFLCSTVCDEVLSLS